MSRTTASAALALGALLLSPIACSREDAPTSPQLSPTAPLSSSAEFDADGDGKLNDAERATKQATEEALKALKRAVAQQRRADKEARKRAFESLRDDWRAYKDSVKAGFVDADLLRCAPLPFAAQTKTIGPRGGELRVGPHRLFIPAGALASEVEITGVSIPGARRGVEFAPHGLQFRQPVRLTMSFEKCTVPAAGDVQVVYTGPGFQIVARQPSLADDELTQVDAWTDHFSGYVVAIGRR